MTDVMDAVLNGDGDTNESLEDHEIVEGAKSQENDDEGQEGIDETEGNDDGTMEIEEEGNDDSMAFPDTSQSDPTDNAGADGEDTETEDLQDEREKLNNDTEGDNKTTMKVEEDELAGGDVNLDMLTEVEMSAVVKSEPPQDEDTLISQDENELLEDDDDEQNNFSTEETEPVLTNNISDSVSSGNKAMVSTRTSSATSSSRTLVRNGETNESKPLLSGLLNRNESSSLLPSRNFSIADGNEIVKELEHQVSTLTRYISKKEKELLGLCKLRSHMEFALEQVKCTQRTAKVEEEQVPLSMTEIKACINLFAANKEAFSLAERQMDENIESLEAENESLHVIFPFRSSSQAKESTSQQGSKSESLTATAALQKLCERKRKAVDDIAPAKSSRIRITDVQSNASQIQSKVIGNGRKGAIVDVQSIIQSHRNMTGDKPQDRRIRKTVYTTTAINMQPERQYLKTLEELMAMAEAERQKESTVALAPPPTVTQIRSITPKPKNGKPVRQSGSNSLLANPTSSGSGTLAKMLSPSTHSSIGSNRSSNDVTTTSQKFSTKLPTSDANLSLANLLATSKVETKVNLTKVKKERNARDDDNSQVPSQQEAVPICQGCNLSRAQFVCAGCANQWYCSRECQVAAWDEHSEICSG